MDYFFYNTDARALTGTHRPRFHLLIDHGFAAVGGDRQHFGQQIGRLNKDDILLMYENGLGVIALGKVVEKWNGVSYKIPKYYSLAEIKAFEGGACEYRIAVDWFLDISSSPIGLKELRNRFGGLPRGAVRKIVDKRSEAERIIEELRTALPALPEEISQASHYEEGATRRVLVNAYERNREAVLRCKEKQGTACVVCGFDFGAIYGIEFAGFIHVHHLRPLSEVGVKYLIDPDTDLRPVCPNCHAVIHHNGQLRSIEEVRKILAPQKSAK